MTEALPFPFEQDLSADSAPELAMLRGGGPVARVRLPDGQLAWLPLRRADIRTVFGDARFSRSAATRPGAPGVGPATSAPGMLTGLDPPEHTRVRRLVSKAFSARTVDRKRSQIKAIVDELLDEVEVHGSPSDLIPAFARPLPLRVITAILGVPYADRDQFSHLVTVITAATASSPAQVKAALTDLTGYLARLIAAKRAEPADDLLTALVDARDEGNALSEQELLMNAHLILVAGHDTTANHLANSLVALFRHPAQLDRLRERPQLLPSAVEELLRYVQLETTGNVRIATEDVELSGVTIRAGDAVIPMGHLASNDPEEYPDARRLDVTRVASPAHMAFGSGPHHCPGAALARMELELALGSLLARLPGLRLAEPADELSWRPGMVMRNLTALPVAWDHA
ncbi:MAG TPA: cytochrome P450 [Trebonia sp.]|nr:cytochrome P450 [Trebonia sp.]